MSDTLWSPLPSGLLVPLLLLATFLVIGLGSVVWPQPQMPPQVVSPDKQLKMLQRELRWERQQHAETKQALSDAWAQADELEVKVKQLQGELEKLKKDAGSVKEKADAPPSAQ